MSSNLWSGRWRGRTPAGDVHQRARNVISPSGGIVRGKFPSRKNGRMVHHEGLLELDAIYLFEASPLIVRYREQPSTIHFPDGDRLRRYTPDFELTLTTGEIVLVEVKPMRSLDDDDVRHKFDCVEAHMRRSAIPFVILTDKILRQEPRQSSLRWIYHQAPRVPPAYELARMTLSRYKSFFPLPINAAVVLFAECEVDPYSLLLAGLLRCELGAPLSLDTLINFNTESDNDWFWIAQEHGF